MWIHLDCTERETTVEGNVIPDILRHHQTFFLGGGVCFFFLSFCRLTKKDKKQKERRQNREHFSRYERVDNHSINSPPPPQKKTQKKTKCVNRQNTSTWIRISSNCEYKQESIRRVRNGRLDFIISLTRFYSRSVIAPLSSLSIDTTASFYRKIDGHNYTNDRERDVYLSAVLFSYISRPRYFSFSLNEMI